MNDPRFDACATCGHYRSEHRAGGGHCTCDVLVTLVFAPARWERCACPAYADQETAA